MSALRVGVIFARFLLVQQYAPDAGYSWLLKTTKDLCKEVLGAVGVGTSELGRLHATIGTFLAVMAHLDIDVFSVVLERQDETTVYKQFDEALHDGASDDDLFGYKLVSVRVCWALRGVYSCGLHLRRSC